MNKFAIALCAALFLAHAGSAQPVRVEAVEVELVARDDAAVPGATTQIGLRIRHDPEWHSYWRTPGDSGLPTELKLTLPEGWSAGEIAWPAPQRVFIGPLANYGYGGETLLRVPLTVPASQVAGTTARLSGKAQWLMCREVCIPGEAVLTLELPVREKAAPGRHLALFERAERETPKPGMTLRAGRSGSRVTLAFERENASSAEFFPYREAWLDAPAPQALFRDKAEKSRWWLELSVYDSVDDAALAKAGFTGEPLGVLVLDGQAHEVSAKLEGAALAGGQLIASAKRDESAAKSFFSPGTASRLLSGAGAAFSPGAGGSSAASPGAGGSATLTLAFALVFALIGGLLLNLMPCVFPVIGLKVLAFARHAGALRVDAQRGALAFAAGVLASFTLLAAALLGLRAAGEAVGWGFQLQSPVFVAAMALLFVAIALNFAGVYEVGLRMTRLGAVESAAVERHPLLGSFGAGVLAVLVATPCSAPFMGSALGYTLGRPAPEVFAVFAALALGMSIPYLALGYFPGALRWLPRPGRWMESFKQFLAFPMLLTVAWLMWVLGLQAGVDAVLAVSAGAVLIALAAWLYGRFVQAGPKSHRWLAGVLAASSLAAGLWVGLPGPASSPAQGASSGASASSGPDASQASGWEPWSEAAISTALGAQRAVFVDFTAAWCVSCQVNKALVLEREPVVGQMQRRGVLRLRADWTNRDPEITAALARHGRNGVPLYLLYLPGEAVPRVLPEILTSGIVLDALSAMR
ncbi:MAG: thioredoxin family protein [Burkholderiaceae bacterium]|nr:thioredoxin family protein [Burkholderiaceae bacterium]